MKGLWGTPRLLIAMVTAMGLVLFAQSGGLAPAWQPGESVFLAEPESWVAPSSTPPGAAREHLHAAWQLARPATGGRVAPPGPERVTWPDSAEFRDPQQSSYRTAGPRSPPVSQSS